MSINQRHRGFVIIWGRRSIDSMAGAPQPAVCPKCRQYALFYPKTRCLHSHIFFIPLSQIGPTRTFSECSQCGARFTQTIAQLNQYAATKVTTAQRPAAAPPPLHGVVAPGAAQIPPPISAIAPAPQTGAAANARPAGHSAIQIAGIILTVLGGLMGLSTIRLAFTRYNLANSHDLSMFIGGAGFSILILAAGIGMLLNERLKKPSSPVLPDRSKYAPLPAGQDDSDEAEWSFPRIMAWVSIGCLVLSILCVVVYATLSPSIRAGFFGHLFENLKLLLLVGGVGLATVALATRKGHRDILGAAIAGVTLNGAVLLATGVFSYLDANQAAPSSVSTNLAAPPPAPVSITHNSVTYINNTSWSGQVAMSSPTGAVQPGGATTLPSPVLPEALHATLPPRWTVRFRPAVEALLAAQSDFADGPGVVAGAGFRSPIVVVYVMDEADPTMKQIRSASSARFTALRLIVDNTAGKTPVTIDPAQVEITALDSTKLPAMAASEVFSADQQSMTTRFGGPYTIDAGGKLTDGVLFIPAGIEPDKIRSFLIVFTGRRMNLGAKMMQVADKTALIARAQSASH